MDLHISAEQPTDAERSVIAATVPEATTTIATDRAIRGGHAARQHRHLLLPVLAAVQAEIGWVSPGAVAEICRRLSVPPAEVYGVATFYALIATEEAPPRVAHLCDDVGCGAFGADAVIRDVEAALGPAGTDADGVTWARSPCLGQCDRAPAAYLQLAGEPDQVIVDADAAGVIAALRADPAAPDAGVPAGGAVSGSSAAPDAGVPAGGAVSGSSAAPAGGAVSGSSAAGVPAGGAVSGSPIVVPQQGEVGLRLLRRIGAIDPASLDDHVAHGGDAALRRAVELGPDGVRAEVATANLRGRGGAAFPTAVKWNAVAGSDAPVRYLICNADESEPGTFKDRVLLEGDPHRLLESMTIAAHATGCEQGYLYVRGEYPVATSRLQHAIDQRRRAGLLGGDVLGAGFAFDIDLRRGQGAYICGEETALMESIEGQRGEPRNKPPFPTDAGLFGAPTVINNVETLCNLPEIVLDGGAVFAATGTPDSTGTRLFCLSGAVAVPGTYEVPFGTTLRELLDLAGGVVGELGSILLGGAAGSFIGADHLDVPLTFEDTRARGLALGSGVVMPFDRATDMGPVVARIAAFFRDETCGQCVPCRVGVVRQQESLARYLGNGRDSVELTLLADIDRAMTDASICGLGQTAASAVRSAIKLGIV